MPINELLSAGTGLTGGGSVSLGGTTTLNLATRRDAGSFGRRANITVDAQGRLTAASNGASVNLASESAACCRMRMAATGQSAICERRIVIGFHGQHARQSTLSAAPEFDRQ